MSRDVWIVDFFPNIKVTCQVVFNLIYKPGNHEPILSLSKMLDSLISLGGSLNAFEMILVHTIISKHVLPIFNHYNGVGE
jgi:hypothetical protein